MSARGARRIMMLEKQITKGEKELKKEFEKLTPRQMNMIREVAGFLSPDESWGMDEIPPWYDTGTNRIDEVEFCQWFMERHSLRYVNGLFYDIDGILKTETLTKEVVEILKPFVKTSIARRAERIIEELRYDAMTKELPRKTDRVHMKNGTYLLDGGFTETKEFCSNRIPVNYNPLAPDPVTWLQFLDELLYPEDITTLQEFMGYMLIPSTAAQTMLMIVGSGGEGKSRVGVACRNLLGDNMNTCSLSKLANDRFCAADQEGKLLMVDDDMNMEALTDTGRLKAIITMEDKMDLEKKGMQSYQGFLYIRLMAFGNGALSSLYDRSDGFYRRQIILRTKEKPADRVDDRFLSEKIAAETEGILLWCLQGLHRLRRNGFHFSISDRTKTNLEEMRRDEDNIMDFLDSVGYIRFDPDALCTTKDFYNAYKLWCEDNVSKPRSEISFSKEMKDRANKYGIAYVKHVPLPSGTTARGYKGVTALHTLKDCPFYKA